MIFFSLRSSCQFDSIIYLRWVRIAQSIQQYFVYSLWKFFIWFFYTFLFSSIISGVLRYCFIYCHFSILTICFFFHFQIQIEIESLMSMRFLFSIHFCWPMKNSRLSNSIKPLLESTRANTLLSMFNMKAMTLPIWYENTHSTRDKHTAHIHTQRNLITNLSTARQVCNLRNCSTPFWIRNWIGYTLYTVCYTHNTRFFWLRQIIAIIIVLSKIHWLIFIVQIKKSAFLWAYTELDALSAVSLCDATQRNWTKKNVIWLDWREEERGREKWRIERMIGGRNKSNRSNLLVFVLGYVRSIYLNRTKQNKYIIRTNTHPDPVFCVSSVQLCESLSFHHQTSIYVMYLVVLFTWIYI